MQETCLVALRRFGDLRDPAAAGPWLRTVVRNVSRMEHRRPREFPGLPPDLAMTEAGPEAGLEGLAVRDWVWTALSEFPAEVRTAMIAALDAMTTHGRTAVYFADCSPDLLVSAPAMGYECRGVDGGRRTIEAGLAAGVRMRLVRLVAAGGVTIVESEDDNPPEDPQHCPPWHTEIRIHPVAVTTRLVLHFGDRR